MALYLTFYVLQVLDAVLTVAATNMGAVEINPLMDWLLTHWGDPGFTVVKLLVAAVSTGLLWSLRDQASARRTTMVLTVIYGLVCLSNAIQLGILVARNG